MALTEEAAPSMTAADALVSTGLVGLGAGLTWLIQHGTRKEEAHQKLLDRIAELERSMGAVNLAVMPLTAAYQQMLIAKLTHFHTPEMDALMQKITPDTLTREETLRLGVLLEERERDMGNLISPQERIAAHLLPGVVALAKHEVATGGAAGDAARLLVVSIPVVPEVPIIVNLPPPGKVSPP